MTTMFRDSEYGVLSLRPVREGLEFIHNGLCMEDAGAAKRVLRRYGVFKGTTWRASHDVHPAAALSAVVGEMRLRGYEDDRLAERAIFKVSEDEARRPDLPASGRVLVHEAVERGIRQQLQLAASALSESYTVSQPSIKFFQRPNADALNGTRPPFAVARMFLRGEGNGVRDTVMEALAPWREHLVKVSVTETHGHRAVEVGLRLPQSICESFRDEDVPVFEHQEVIGVRDVVLALESPLTEEEQHDVAELGRACTGAITLRQEDNKLTVRIPSGFVGHAAADRALRERLVWLVNTLEPWGPTVEDISEHAKMNLLPDPKHGALAEAVDAAKLAKENLSKLWIRFHKAWNKKMNKLPVGAPIYSQLLGMVGDFDKAVAEKVNAGGYSGMSQVTGGLAVRIFVDTALETGFGTDAPVVAGLFKKYKLPYPWRKKVEWPDAFVDKMWEALTEEEMQAAAPQPEQPVVEQPDYGLPPDVNALITRFSNIKQHLWDTPQVRGAVKKAKKLVKDEHGPQVADKFQSHLDINRATAMESCSDPTEASAVSEGMWDTDDEDQDYGKKRKPRRTRAEMEKHRQFMARHKKLMQRAYAAQGTTVMPDFDREDYPPLPGLEGPWRFRKSGRILYYDPRAGEYYDRKSDMYVDSRLAEGERTKYSQAARDTIDSEMSKLKKKDIPHKKKVGMAIAVAKSKGQKVPPMPKRNESLVEGTLQQAALGRTLIKSAGTFKPAEFGQPQDTTGGDTEPEEKNQKKAKPDKPKPAKGTTEPERKDDEGDEKPKKAKDDKGKKDDEKKEKPKGEKVEEKWVPTGAKEPDEYVKGLPPKPLKKGDIENLVKSLAWELHPTDPATGHVTVPPAGYKSTVDPEAHLRKGGYMHRPTVRTHKFEPTKLPMWKRPPVIDIVKDVMSGMTMPPNPGPEPVRDLKKFITSKPEPEKRPATIAGETHKDMWSIGDYGVAKFFGRYRLFHLPTKANMGHEFPGRRSALYALKLLHHNPTFASGGKLTQVGEKAIYPITMAKVSTSDQFMQKFKALEQEAKKAHDEWSVKKKAWDATMAHVTKEVEKWDEQVRKEMAKLKGPMIAAKRKKLMQKATVSPEEMVPSKVFVDYTRPMTAGEMLTIKGVKYLVDQDELEIRKAATRFKRGIARYLVVRDTRDRFYELLINEVNPTRPETHTFVLHELGGTKSSGAPQKPAVVMKPQARGAVRARQRVLAFEMAMANGGKIDPKKLRAQLKQEGMLNKPNFTLYMSKPPDGNWFSGNVRSGWELTPAGWSEARKRVPPVTSGSVATKDITIRGFVKDIEGLRVSPREYPRGARIKSGQRVRTEPPAAVGRRGRERMAMAGEFRFRDDPYDPYKYDWD